MELLSLFLLPAIVLLLTGPVAVDLFLRLSAGEHRRLRGLFWGVFVMLIAVVSVFSAYTFANFFPGPGCFISIFAPLVASLTFLRMRRRLRRKDGSLEGETARRRLSTAAALIALLQFSIPVFGFGYARACDALNRRAAQPIIAALEAYRADHGDYPRSSGQSDVQALIPTHLATQPQVACAIPPALQSDWYTLNQGWGLYDCGPERGIRLLAPILGSDSLQTYDPVTGEWSVGSYFDGICR